MAARHSEYGTAIFGSFEPSMDYQFLPGCRNCGGSHPLARKPRPENIEVCPDCSEPAGEPGPVHTEYAALRNTPAVLFGRACLWVGRSLNKLYERM